VPEPSAPRRRLRPAAGDLAAGFLPGALAGGQVATLLFFLNPHLPFTAATVGRAVALYGGLLGLLGLLFAFAGTRGRLRRLRRRLPWGLTGTLVFGALLDWTHASYYAYFLPSGINDRLIRTALWLSLAALACFYTALLHGLHRRRYGWRSRIGIGLLALLGLAVAVERRQAYQPRRMPAPRPVAVEPGARPRLVVVGLSTATLDALLPLAADGRLPFLATALRDGAYGRLATLSPHRPDALWATLATGKYPSKHGVTGSARYTAAFLGPGAELRLLPAGIGFRLWGTFGGRQRGERPPERRAAALWELLPGLGTSCLAVAWPASAPRAAGRPALEALVTDGFFKDSRASEGTAAAFPADMVERARLFAVDPAELDPALVESLGPAVNPLIQAALAGDLWRESLALFLPEQHPADALFLVLPGLETASRQTFGGYSVVEFEGAKARLFHEAAQLLAAYYAHLDRFLADLWERQPEPKLLAVVSAYGIDGPGGWRQLQGEMSRRAALEGEIGGAPDGALVLYGAGIRPGTLLTGAQISDLAPTLLYGLGFPVARDFDGKVLTAAFDRAFLARNAVTFVPTYEEPDEEETPQP
jgi:hypothetical protein